VTRLKWKLVLVYLEIVLILMQDRCTVCAEHTIVTEIVMDTPDENPSDVGHVESRFCPFGDNVCLCWCKIGARFATNIAYSF
jgi:hypothetical protein